MINYVPAPELFPEGLKAFRDRIAMPLITHNRWIERDSPYRKQYAISGIGAVDPRWWDMIAANIASWGVQTYEQDWQNYIYQYSPEFFTTTWAGDRFFDGMADACAKHGLTMQYCMSLPRCYLQGGAKYSNLTTMRVSGDRFNRERWREFLYASRFASALGMWPWADVFMSSERENLLLATLSAGMVGIGDAYGRENPTNIACAVRPDGVIVKPDVALVPTDQSTIADATSRKACISAVTFTQTGQDRRIGNAAYLFSYNETTNDAPVLTRPCDIGFRDDVFIYDYFAGTGRRSRSTDSLPVVSAGGTAYVIVVPIDRNGLALIGDSGKFVTRGAQRIAALRHRPDGMTVSVLLARSESDLSLVGYASSRPTVSANSGTAVVEAYDATSGQFRLGIRQSPHAPVHREGGDPVTTMAITIRRGIHPADRHNEGAHPWP